MALPNKAVITLLLNPQHTFICHLITQECFFFFFFFYDWFQTGDMFIMQPFICNKSLSRNINRNWQFVNLSCSFWSRRDVTAGEWCIQHLWRGKNSFKPVNDSNREGTQMMKWCVGLGAVNMWHLEGSISPQQLFVFVLRLDLSLPLKHYRLLPHKR